MSLRVLITAGAAGIGAVAARDFAARGDRVAVCDTNPDTLAEFAESHPTLATQSCDVTDEGQVDTLFDWAVRTLGGLDVVWANAGIAGPAGPIEHIALDDWRATLAVNLDGAFLTARRAALVFKQQGAGLLLFTSSSAGLLAYPNRTPYASAKWAIGGLTRALAMELGEFGVRVNAIAPGAVRGERMERVIEAEAQARGLSQDAVRDLYVQGVGMKTWVDAEDIVNTALFLASPAGNKVSGQVLSVDGYTDTICPY
ncbi:MAG: SDR family oxidoreductase [Pseudomonadota bacterium]